MVTTNEKQLIDRINKTFYYFTNINISYFSFDNKEVISFLNTYKSRSKGLKSIKEILEAYKNKSDKCTVIKENIVENYILMKHKHIDCIFIAGPFLNEKITESEVHELNSIINDLDKDSIKNYYNNYVSLIPKFMNTSLKVLLTSLCKLDYEDIPSTSDDSYTDALQNIESNYIYSSWKYDIKLNNTQFEDEFYESMFMAENIDELRDVLIKYYFISQPFEIASENYTMNKLRAMKNLVISSAAITYTYSIKYGLDTLTALNLLILFNEKIEQADSKADVLQLRTDLLIGFYKAVRLNELKEINPLVRKIRVYINNKIRSPIQVKQIANVLGYNTDYISHVYKSETGETILSYINKRKIDMAKKLLANSLDSITDISSYLGYNSVNQFSRLFKKIAGMSPSSYRKMDVKT